MKSGVAYFDFRRFHRSRVRTTKATSSADVTNPTYVLALSANRPVELPSLGTKNRNRVIAMQKPSEAFSGSISFAYSGFSSSIRRPRKAASVGGLFRLRKQVAHLLAGRVEEPDYDPSIRP